MVDAQNSIVGCEICTQGAIQIISDNRGVGRVIKVSHRLYLLFETLFLML
jgi:hypothetical protein